MGRLWQEIIVSKCKKSYFRAWRTSHFCNYVRAAQIDEEMIAANHQEAKIASKQNGEIVAANISIELQKKVTPGLAITM